MRLIDADKIEYEWKANDNLIAFKKDIDEMPIIDAIPVVHGHWIECRDGQHECSNCHIYITGSYGKYCSNCGAKMDEE